MAWIANPRHFLFYKKHWRGFAIRASVFFI